MSKIEVRITANAPIFIEADADAFGNVFSRMFDDEQVHVLRAMVDHMQIHPTQWDYIAIALEKEENHDVRDKLRYVLFPDSAAKDVEIAKLRRIATDRRYMLDAYRAMLGPTALQVVQAWEEKGVTRQHTDWGPEANKLTGEERAAVLLSMEAAVAVEVDLESQEEDF